MNPPTCPGCRRPIGAEDIHVARDVAFCRTCKVTHSFADLVKENDLAEVDVNRPPAGTWYTASGMETVMGASYRSIGGALGALALCLFWNGIVAVFVALALAGTLNLLGVVPPEWFPSPTVEGAPMGKGMVIFLWLFLTPFIVIGAVLVGALLMALAGRTEIRLRSGVGAIFTGIGPFGLTRRFPATAVKSVRIRERSWHDSDGDARSRSDIVLEQNDGTEIAFGKSLRDDRRRFLAAALRRAVRHG